MKRLSNKNSKRIKISHESTRIIHFGFTRLFIVIKRRIYDFFRLPRIAYTSTKTPIFIERFSAILSAEI